MNINMNNLASTYDAVFSLPDDQAKENYFKTHWLHNNGEISRKSAIGQALCKICCLITKLHHKIFGISNEQPFKIEEQFKNMRDDFLNKTIKVGAKNSDKAAIAAHIPEAVNYEKCIVLVAIFCKYVIRNKDDAKSKSLNATLDADINKTAEHIKNYESIMNGISPSFAALLKD